MNKVDNIKKLFGSNTRVKLLNLFLKNSYQPYYVREITRLIDEQINSVRRELNNLEEIGLVKKMDKDRKVYYQLDDSSDLIASLEMMFSDETAVKTESQKPQIEMIDEDSDTLNWLDEISGVKSDLKTLVISGSFLDDLDAEVDMLLVGDNSKKQLSKWAQRLEKRLARDLRYIILSQRDFEYRLAAKDKFIIQLLKLQHKVVFDEIGKI